MVPLVAPRAPSVAIYSGILSAVNKQYRDSFLTRGWVKFGVPRWVILRLPFPIIECDLKARVFHTVKFPLLERIGSFPKA